jgi:hypothetical protein
VIEAQIYEYQDIVRRFVYTSETVLGSGVVGKKNLLGLETSCRLVITNFPRLLIIDPFACRLKDQIVFTKESPPTLKVVRLHHQSGPF